MSKRQQIEKFRKTHFGLWLEGYYLSWRFRKEKTLYSGKRLSKNDKTSILHFSVNKSATQHTKEVLKTLTAPEGLIPIDYNDYAFHSSNPFLDHLTADEMKNFQHLFIPKGYLFSVFGGFVHGIRELSRYKILLMVRDPRDILVSDYFSISKSHPEPSKGGDKAEAFLERRFQSQSQTIDAFVLSEAGQYYSRLSTYLHHLDGKPNVLLLRYEDMISDYKSWLESIIRFLELSPDTRVMEKLLNDRKKGFGGQENQSSHHRKGVHRDFLEKLKPETISTLNAQFKDILTKWGYE